MSDRTGEFLLNAMERAAQQKEPAHHGYGEKRDALLLYIRGLEALRDQVMTLQVGAKSARELSARVAGCGEPQA